MRKYRALFMALVCVLGLVGCSQQGQQDIATPTQNNEEISRTVVQSESEQDLQFEIVEIRDREKEENLPCDTALEKFYEDESNEYYFSIIKSQYVVVTYNDGSSEDIVTALNADRITMADLDEFNIEYRIEPKSYTIEGNMKTYYEMSDGTWQFDGHTYKYRLEISGRQPLAVKDTTYIYLSNIEDISFQKAMMASGLSSNMEDYFAIEEAVLVEIY